VVGVAVPPLKRVDGLPNVIAIIVGETIPARGWLRRPQRFLHSTGGVGTACRPVRALPRCQDGNTGGLRGDGKKLGWAGRTSEVTTRERELAHGQAIDCSNGLWSLEILV